MRECPYMSEIRRLHKPVIVSPYATAQIDGLPNICSDHVEIGRMAADHLIERGFRRFAFCGHGNYFWPSRCFHGLCVSSRTGPSRPDESSSAGLPVFLRSSHFWQP